MNLAIIAKERGDPPEVFLRLPESVADSRHPEAALAAGYIAFYLRGDTTDAIDWYQRTLDGTDDPELVGEAAYRIGEILHGSGRTDSARTYLDRAAASEEATFAAKATSLIAATGQMNVLDRNDSDPEAIVWR